MKKIKNLLLILVCTILIFTPYYAYATEEQTNQEEPETSETTTPTESPEPSVSPLPEPSESPEPSVSPSPSITPSPSPSVSPEPSEEPKDYKITLNQTEMELATEKTATLKATVTPDEEDIEIVWSSSDDEIISVDQNGKITTGTKAAKGIIITATIKGTEVKATCTIDVSRTISKDATLKSLNISNGMLDQTFKANVLKYSVTVESDVNSLRFDNLKDCLSDSNAGYHVTGNSGLKNGSVVKILVTAEDKETQKTYELTIVKDTTSLDLKKLEINGYALNESFDPETLEYTASIPYEIETITVNAPAKDSDATVKISGLTNLKVGKNTVTITVKDESGNTKKYEIIVTREKEVSVEEKPTSIITSSNINNDNQTSSDSIVLPKNEGEGDNFLKYAIVSLACLILFAIGGIGIYFYLKTSPKNLRKELKNIKELEPTSPIVEVSNDNTEAKQNSSIVEAMQEDLVQTREFNVDDLENNPKSNDLSDDSKDV